MSRQTRQNALVGTSSARFIEYLQVGAEKVVIDVRPMHITTDNPDANKWMDPSHWNELYAILLECANDHIKSTDKYYKEQKAQTELLKVLYKFEPVKKGFQDILKPYNFHSKYPCMALDDLEGSPVVQPYFNMVVVLVFPGESSVVGFDDIPTYFEAKSKKTQDNLPKRNLNMSLASRSKNRKEKIKNLFESSEPESKPNFISSDSPAKNKAPVHNFKSEDESCSDLSDLPDHVYYFEPEEPSRYEYENCQGIGDSPVWRATESESPNVLSAHVVSPLESCLPNSQFQDSPDMFAEYKSVESSCKNRRPTGVDSASSLKETCAPLKFPGDHTVLKREMSPAGKFPGKRKKLRRMLVPSSSAEEGSVGSEKDGASQTKSEHVVSDCDDHGDGFDKSPTSLSRKPFDSLHGTSQDVATIETSTESEVADVNGMPSSNEEKRSKLMQGLPWEPDTDDETMMECPGKPCESMSVDSPVAREEEGLPSTFRRWSPPTSSESDSDKDPQSSASKRRKRKRRFSKHELERQRNGSPPSMSLDSLLEDCCVQSDGSKQRLADGELNVHSSGSTELNESDCSPFSRLRKKKLFGNEKETTPSKNNPSSTASTKIADKVKSAASEKSPKKKACDNKRGDKQSDSHKLSDKQSDNCKGGDKQSDNSKGGDKQSDNSKGGDKLSDNSKGGDKQSDNSKGSDKLSDNSKGRDKQSDNSKGGDKLSDNSKGGDKQSDNSKGGDKLSDNSKGRDKQSDNSKGGDKQSDSSKGGDKQSDNSKGGNNRSDNSKGGDKLSDNSKGRDKQSDNSKGGDKQSDSSKGGDKQSDNSKGGNNRSDNSKGGDKQTDSSKGGEKQSDNSKGGDKQSDNSKGGDKQSDSSKGGEKQTKAPPRGVRSSPRKVGAVCYSEQGNKRLEAGPSEAATKRISPRKKTLVGQEKSEVPKNVQKKSQELAKQKGGRGRGRKGSDAQKRVQKRLSLGSTGQKGSQITDYFGASDKKHSSSITETVKTTKVEEANTSSLTSKAILLAEKKMEAMCKDMFLSDSDSDSSDNLESKFVSHKDRGPRAKEMAVEKAHFVGIIKNLSLEEITKTFKKNCVTYHGIFKGHVHCVRHELYKAGEEQRINLRYSTSTNPFTEVQLSHMMDLLTKKFCKDNPLHFSDYFWKVLIPELANHVIMAQFDLGYDQSLAKIRDLYRFAYSDSD